MQTVDSQLKVKIVPQKTGSQSLKNKYLKNNIHNTLKIRQNIFTVFLERLKVFVSRYGPRTYRPEYHAVLYSTCQRPNARLQ